MTKTQYKKNKLIREMFDDVTDIIDYVRISTAYLSPLKRAQDFIGVLDKAICKALGIRRK